MSSVPFTLRNTLSHNPEERKSLGTLFFVFVGERSVYSAQFLGGVEDQNLVINNEQDRRVRPMTNAEWARPIHCVAMSLERLVSGCFAAFLVERLSVHMRRLRLSGDDPFMVFDKAWNEVWNLLLEFQKKNNLSDVVVGVALDEALQAIIEHHHYGPAIARLREWRRAKIQALVVESELQGENA